MKIRKIVASGSAHTTPGRARKPATITTRSSRTMQLEAFILPAGLCFGSNGLFLRHCGKPVHESCKTCGEADSQDFSSFKFPDE
jgi:hypothetical protein